MMLKKNRTILRWPIVLLIAFAFIAIFKNYIANDIPLISKVDNHYYFPVFNKDMQALIGSDSYNQYLRAKMNGKITMEIFPLIPYHANTLDKKNIHYVHPFKAQNITSLRYRHLLGTDQLGRDILARIIHGSSTALQVALFSSIIALIIGLLLGLLAGFYQDDRWKMGIISIVFWGFGILMMIYVCFFQRSYELLAEHWSQWIISFLMMFAFIIAWRFLDNNISRKFGNKVYNIPIDLLIMRIVEAYKSIPLLLLIFTVLAIFETPSLTHVIWIIGLTRWTTITRYVRAEVLHIRNQEYINAAIASGLPDKNILWNHALPNALSPIIVSLAFSMSSAIILEATLSFLGIGIPTSTISWGSIIQEARSTTSAWWAVVFPGLAIFLLVLAFNKVAEYINDKR